MSTRNTHHTHVPHGGTPTPMRWARAFADSYQVREDCPGFSHANALLGQEHAWVADCLRRFHAIRAYRLRQMAQHLACEVTQFLLKKHRMHEVLHLVWEANSPREPLHHAGVYASDDFATLGALGPPVKVVDALDWSNL
eukprot:scaffold2697_cov392-Prasinococcus_capsulatus_cf.AAC.15